MALFLSPSFKGLMRRPTRQASCRFFVIRRCRQLLPSLRPVPQQVATAAVLRCHKGRFTTRNGLYRTAIRPLWDACWAASGGFALPCRVFSSPAAAFRPGCLATASRPPAHGPGMLAHGGRLQPRGAPCLGCGAATAGQSVLNYRFLYDCRAYVGCFLVILCR